MTQIRGNPKEKFQIYGEKWQWQWTGRKDVRGEDLLRFVNSSVLV